jgi:YHS domain-containing protein
VQGATYKDSDKYDSVRVKDTRGDAMVVVDPVCKMELDEKDTTFKTEYKGKTYYFCGLSDKKIFDEDPEKYVES